MNFFDVLIRQTTVADVTKIFEIQAEVGLSYWSIDDYIFEVTNYEAIFLVAELEQNVIGFILIRLITTLNICEILNFGVCQSQQKNGIGKQLLQESVKYLKLININKVELEVREKNTQAINFYLKNNFIPDGVRKNFYLNPNDNAILMSMDISHKI